jgi:hypothetical protein
MGNHAGDKVEGSASNGDALVRVGVDVPVGDELAIVVGDVRGSEWRVAEIATDVFGGIEALGVETVTLRTR